MNWKHLTELNQLGWLIEESNSNPILIFKHSKSCSISRAALNKLERNWNLDIDSRAYLLDLLAFRNVSNAIEEKFNVQHESPQVLIISQGKSVYDSSHFDINYGDIKDKLLLVEN